MPTTVACALSGRGRTEWTRWKTEKIWIISCAIHYADEMDKKNNNYCRTQCCSTRSCTQFKTSGLQQPLYWYRSIKHEICGFFYTRIFFLFYPENQISFSPLAVWNQIIFQETTFITHWKRYNTGFGRGPRGWIYVRNWPISGKYIHPIYEPVLIEIF